MKKKIQRFIVILLITAFSISILPVNVSAWKSATHVNSADIILFEMKRAAKESPEGVASVEIFAPYDSDEGISYEVPDEFQEAIFSYPDAFRAGSMGPDFYPDMITGQTYIHPYNNEKDIDSGEWVSLLCESVNRLPQESESRKEALSFTLGVMLHYCGDMFGHDFINSFAGGAFPNMLETGKEALKGDTEKLNYMLSHMAEETYMDGLVNTDFYQKNGYMTSGAPVEFVADTMIFDGSVNGGASKIYDRYGSVPFQYSYLVNFRTTLYDKANEWRESINPIYIAAVAYLDAWIADIDRATYALVDCFDKMATETVNDREEAMEIAIMRLMEWLDEYGKYITPAPDVLIDTSSVVKEALEVIFKGIDFTKLMNEYKQWKRQLILNVAETVIGVSLDVIDSESVNDFMARLDNPQVQLDHKDNAFDPTGEKKNFEEFKEYMERYAKEQELLNTVGSVNDLINGTDNGVLDRLIDSELEAFYNTMVMFKLILIGPDNFTSFMRELSGHEQSVYQPGEGVLSATSVHLEITTTNTQNAGTDDNVFAIVYRVENGNKTQLTKKLLDNSLHDDFEAGAKDVYSVELPEAVPVDEIEISIVQEEKIAAASGWDCANINVTLMHAGAEIVPAVGVGGNAKMDSGKTWDLRFQDAIAAREIAANAQTVMNLKVKIDTADVLYAGTDDDIYMVAYNKDNPDEEWTRVLLDKKNHNDFERDSSSTYDVSVAKYINDTTLSGLPLDKLGLKIVQVARDYAGSAWNVENVTVTPCYGNLKLAEAVSLGGNANMDSGKEWDIKFHEAALSYKEYEPITYSYATLLDDGLLYWQKSLDDSSQWIADENILWNDETIRSNVFFEIFKGFSPEIEYKGSQYITEDQPAEITLELRGMWNGIGEHRRNSGTAGIDAPPVGGNVSIAFFDQNNQMVKELTAAVPEGTNGVYTVLCSVPAGELAAGMYDIKAAYTSDSQHNYADTEVTFTDVLEIAGDTDTMVAEPEVVDFGEIHYTETEAPVKTITVTGAEEKLKITLENGEESAFSYVAAEDNSSVSITLGESLSVGEYKDYIKIVSGAEKETSELLVSVYANVTMKDSTAQNENVTNRITAHIYRLPEADEVWGNLSEEKKASFLGWSVPSEGTEVIYPAGASYELSADAEFVAVWGDEHNWEHLYTYDDVNHWLECMDEGCTEVKDMSEHSLSTVDSDNNGTYVTYCSVCGYIKEESFCEITFDANGGSWGTATEKTVYAEAGKLQDTPDNPVYEGMHFVGWFDSAAGGTEIDLTAENEIFRENTKIYAHWEIKNEIAEIIGAEMTEQYDADGYPVYIDKENRNVMVTVFSRFYNEMTGARLDDVVKLYYTEGASVAYSKERHNFAEGEPVAVTLTSSSGVTSEWSVYVVPKGGSWQQNWMFTVRGFGDNVITTPYMAGDEVTVEAGDDISEEVVFDGWVVEEHQTGNIALPGKETQTFIMPSCPITVWEVYRTLQGKTNMVLEKYGNTFRVGVELAEEDLGRFPLLYVALYNGDGQMIKVLTKCITQTTDSLSISTLYGSAECKAFLLDGNTLAPMCAAETYEIIK